jgi:hypothetical protein
MKEAILSLRTCLLRVFLPNVVEVTYTSDPRPHRPIPNLHRAYVLD